LPRGGAASHRRRRLRRDMTSVPQRWLCRVPRRKCWLRSWLGLIAHRRGALADLPSPPYSGGGGLGVRRVGHRPGEAPSPPTPLPRSTGGEGRRRLAAREKEEILVRTSVRLF